jgi:hypothetical protein
MKNHLRTQTDISDQSKGEFQFRSLFPPNKTTRGPSQTSMVAAAGARPHHLAWACLVNHSHLPRPSLPFFGSFEDAARSTRRPLEVERTNEFKCQRIMKQGSNINLTPVGGYAGPAKRLDSGLLSAYFSTTLEPKTTELKVCIVRWLGRSHCDPRVVSHGW